MRPPLAVLLALAALVPGAAGAAAEPARAAPPRAAIVFLPWPGDQRRPLLEALGRRGMAVGVASPSVGGYNPNQAVLDISQGTRIALGLYPEPPPLLHLEAGGPGGEMDGWSAALRRARGAPGSVRPGLLAATVARAGGRVTYAGPAAGANLEAAVSADRSGRVPRLALRLGERSGAARAWAGADLLVARLPGGRGGLRALDRLLAARGADDLLIAVRAPPTQPEVALLPIGAAGPRLDGAVLRSQSTRRPGLVTVTDLAPTVLRGLGRPVPPAMEGRPLEAVAGDGPATATRLADRLDVILERRNAGLPAALAAWLLAVAVLWAARGRAGLRAGLRLGLLTALWLPGFALVAAALAPALIVEVLLLALGSLLAAAACDRLVGWPRAPAIPAAAVFLAYAVDLAAGSQLTPLSITGSNPRGGARFFGVGNELETLLTISIVLGTGAAVARAARRRAIAAFAVAGLAGAVVMGAGRLGADVGAVIALGAGAAAAAVACLPPGHARRRGALVAIAVPALALAGLLALDALTGGDAHLSRSVVEAESPGDLLDVAERRVRLSAAGLEAVGTALAVVAAIALLTAGVVARRRLLAPLAHRRAGGFAAGITGALAATVAGALANDSGPLIAVVGAAFLGLAVLYARGRPDQGDASAQRDRPHTRPAAARTVV